MATCSAVGHRAGGVQPEKDPLDPGDFDGYRESVLVDAHRVENWWPATFDAPERTEAEKALTLFADWTPGEYDLLD